MGTNEKSTNPLTSSDLECINRIREILAYARASALKSVNAVMVSSYWEIGREIVEEEQRGEPRADYGSKLIKQLSNRLTADFGRGFSVANLRLFRQFFLAYRNRTPKIRYTVCSELVETDTNHLNPDLRG